MPARTEATFQEAAKSPQSANGQELTLSYDGGAQKVIVPENAAIYTQVPGQRSQLASGGAVFLNATSDESGKLSAVRIQLTPVK